MKNRINLGFFLTLIMMVVGFGFVQSPAAVDEQMFETLSERTISADDVAGSSKEDLRILRNSIFAKHGYIFKDSGLKNYFSKYSWYDPQYSDVNEKLTSIETQNIALLKSLENGEAAGQIPEECIDSEGEYIGDENCLRMTEGAAGATGEETETSSGSKLPDEVVQGLWIAFGLLLLFSFIMGATDNRVVFFNLLDFILSLLSFVCLVASPYVVDTEYSWAEIPLLVIGIILFVRIILTCILDNRSIVWGLIMSPLKIIVSVSIVLYPFLWLMEKNNQSTKFEYSANDSRSWREQHASFMQNKKIWSAILLALLALLIWIVKKCLNGKRVYAKRGWSKKDGWNYKMLVGKGQPVAASVEVEAPAAEGDGEDVDDVEDDDED